MNRTEGILRRIAALAKSVIAIFFLIPLVFTLLVSFRPEAEPVTKGNIFFGSEITLENYERALIIAPWGMHYANSLIFVAGVLLVQLATVTCAAYAFARMRFLGRDLLLLIILLQLMIPSGVLLVQNFRMINTLGLFDTRIALMIPYWGSAFGVLLLRQTFREVPIELDEAARIDGANLFQVIRHVYVTQCNTRLSRFRAGIGQLTLERVSLALHYHSIGRNQAPDGRAQQIDQDDRSRRLLRAADGGDADCHRAARHPVSAVPTAIRGELRPQRHPLIPSGACIMSVVQSRRAGAVT